jgi:hypothetical protein
MVFVIATYENVRLIPLPKRALSLAFFPEVVKLKNYAEDKKYLHVRFLILYPELFLPAAVKLFSMGFQ